MRPPCPCIPTPTAAALSFLSALQVAAGTASFVVTAVGPRSMQGSIAADTNVEEGDTPLQVRQMA